MLFFSELIGKAVHSENNHIHGKLSDIIFLNEETPRITKIVVVHSNKSVHTIGIGSIRRINHHIAITKPQLNQTTSPNELSIAKTLLDQQIIDLVGNKVVRVNDVVIQDQPLLSISGIDIGIPGLLRRLGIERPIQKIATQFNAPMPMQLLSWGDVLNLELEHGQIKIKQREEKLAKIHEEDLADYLEMTNAHNVHKFISTLDQKKAAEVLESLTVNYQVEVFQRFDHKKGAELIDCIDPDEAVDILLALDRSKRDKIMRHLPSEKQKELHLLMTFSRTPVGKLMTSEFFTVSGSQTAKEILKAIKKETHEYSSFSAMYVLNRDDQLVGVFSPHELMMQDPDAQAYKFMLPEPIVALLTTPVEVIIYKLLKYNISAIPVINREKKILGIITLDDVSEIVLKKIQ